MIESNIVDNFISIEGIEGAGKTTCLGFIKAWCQRHKLDFVLTREPGGTKVSEQIRSILLNSLPDSVCIETELLLIFAARMQHIHDVILPNLKSGKLVISDRFSDATYAYQGGGRALGFAKIKQLEACFDKIIVPKFTILLDLPVETAMKRVDYRGQNLDRFEQETLSFFQRVRSAYLQIAEGSPERIKVLDATQDIEVMQNNIEQQLNQKLQHRIK